MSNCWTKCSLLAPNVGCSNDTKLDQFDQYLYEILHTVFLLPMSFTLDESSSHPLSSPRVPYGVRKGGSRVGTSRKIIIVCLTTHGQ